MPWDEIENGQYDQEIETLRSLIRLHKYVSTTSTTEISFLYENLDNERLGNTSRVISYLRGNSIIVCINADETPVEVPSGELLLSRKVANGEILPGGWAVVQA